LTPNWSSPAAGAGLVERRGIVAALALGRGGDVDLGHGGRLGFASGLGGA
jgi:hypothetical protein